LEAIWGSTKATEAEESPAFYWQARRSLLKYASRAAKGWQ